MALKDYLVVNGNKVSINVPDGTPLNAGASEVVKINGVVVVMTPAVALEVVQESGFDPLISDCDTAITNLSAKRAKLQALKAQASVLAEEPKEVEK